MIPGISFVAASGTGKTTLLERLIPLLKKRGLRVAVIKHDGHDFAVDQPGKDSWRFTQAGADVSVIISGTHAAIMENRPLSPEELAGRIQNVDLMVTEGYKHGPWPKIGVCREGKPLPIPHSDCIAIVSDKSEGGEVPHFSFGDTQALADFLCDWLEMEKRKGRGSHAGCASAGD